MLRIFWLSGRCWKRVASDLEGAMDSEFDYKNDFLDTHTNDNGAPLKFKPTKCRPKPRSGVVPSTAPDLSKDGRVSSTRTVLNTAQENWTDVTNLSQTSVSDSIGESNTLNNIDEPHFRGSLHQGISMTTETVMLSQQVLTIGDGGSKDHFYEELPVSGRDSLQNNAFEQFPHTAKSTSPQWNPFDDIDLGQSISIVRDDGEVHCSIIMDDHGNTHPSFVDQGFSTCDSSQDQSLFGVTGNQHGLSNRDSTTSKASNIDGGTMKPDNIELFGNDFPPADEYFTINEDSICNSDICRAGASLVDDDMYVETAHEIPVDRVDDSAPAECNETRQPSRVPRKRKARTNEAADGENDGLNGELRSDSAKSRDATKDNNRGDTNLKKKSVRRSRKFASGNDQETRNCRKVNDTSCQQNEKPKKKFSHSTRGRRRHVDPTFLATPDDEIDSSSVTLRDLILRAEFLERDSKKLSTSSSTPATDQRTESTSPLEETNYERNTFDSYQNGEYDDDYREYDDDNIEVQERSSYFNYHSFMKKTPRAAWSKLDTELFYQGIRQFGTDLTLIQQLFPGRSRNQIKLKYKKEEKQHPQRITEAIENRANGDSCFQKVIEQLKVNETKEDQEFSDDPNGVKTNEDNVQEAEFNENASTRLEENDVVAKDDAEAIDKSEVQQDSENMDDDYDLGLGVYTSF